MMKEARRLSLSQGALYSALAVTIVISTVAIVFTPPLVSLTVCAALIAIAVFALRPDFALIPYFLIAFLLPSYPAVDLVTAIVIATSIPAFLRKGRWDLVSSSRLLKPVFALLVLAALGTLYGILCRNKVTFIYREARVFLYWLFFIPLMAWAPEKSPQRWILWMTIACGFIIAGLSVAQGVSGKVFVATGRVGDLESISSATISTIRVQIPGFLFVVFSVLALMSLYLNREIKIIPLLFLEAFLMLGLIYNYGRALWFWTFIGMLIVAACYKVRGIILFTSTILIIALIAIPLLMQLKPSLLDNVVERVESTFHEGGRGTSFGWREFELQKGERVLEKTYLAGVGVGGQYRPPLYSLATWEDYPRYTHNGYLFLALKLSVLGPLIFIFVIGTLVWSAARIAFQNENKRGVAISILAFAVSFGGVNATQPEIMTHYGVLAFVFVAVVLIFLEKALSIPECGARDKSTR
jgi:hypothetical protein